MLRHFYRLMVVILAALTATAATGCGGSDYGAEYVPFDMDAVDEAVFENEAVTPDDDFDVPVDPDDDTADKDSIDAEGLDAEADVSDDGIDYDGYADDTLYGCPYVDYLVEGVVTGVAGSPVEGIEVKMAVEYFYPISTKTDAMGKFTLEQTTDQYCSEFSSLDVEAHDVDGVANGAYQQKTMTVPLVCTYENERQCTNTEVKIELEEVSSDDDTLVNDE